MSSVAAEAVHGQRNGFRERLDSLTAPSGLFIAAVLVIMALPVTRTIQDPDFWWHLRAGQLIIQHGGLLGNDPFTYTVANHHWTMHEWLNEVRVRHRVRRRGPRPYRARALAQSPGSVLIAIMQKARLRHPGRGALGMGMLIAVIAGFPIWGPRVQMITFAFATLTLLLVERHLVQGREGHMGAGPGVPGVEQLSLRFRDRAWVHRDRADRGSSRCMAAHARSRAARATATTALRVDRVHRGEHDQS